MKRRKMVTTAAAAVLLGALAIGGSLAYLTDSETKTNSFTIVQDVDIDLTESSWSSESGEDILPNAVVPKDPMVVNKNAADVVVFIKVLSPKASIDGSDKELFKYYAGDSAPSEKLTDNSFNTDNWIKLDTTEVSDGNAVYLFGYKVKLEENGATDKLFNYVQLIDYKDQGVDASSNSKNPSAADIEVTAYAIQADNLYDGDGAAIDTTGTLTKATLEKIYSLYADEAATAEP